ncbi:MAG TPA: hypothetical protein VGB23_02570 [Nitrospirota bacterium]
MGLVSFMAEGHGPLYFTVNPVYPGRVELKSGLVTGMTEGGRTYSYRKGPDSLLHILRFEDMPEAEFEGGHDYQSGAQAAGTQSLANWFFTVAPPGTRFTYNDPFGGAHAVEFADAVLGFSLTGYRLYSGTLRLIETAGSI